MKVCIQSQDKKKKRIEKEFKTESEAMERKREELGVEMDRMRMQLRDRLFD